MSDYTSVYFSCFEKAFDIPAVLATFSFFGRVVEIRWYGAIIAFGFLLAVLLGGRMAYKWKMSLDKMVDVLIYGTIGGIVGARLYYVFSEWGYYSKHISEIPQIWNGGLAIYGGIIGGIAAAFIVCKVRKMNFYNLLDLAAMSLLLAQGIGRWGNFTNQEAFGTNTDMPWGMWSEKTAYYITTHQAEFAARGFTVDPDLPVHPTFLYESLWCLAGFALLYLMCRKWRKFSGQLFLCYGIWYGAERCIVEGLRTDSLYIANTNIRVSQAISLALVVVCTVALIMLLMKYKKIPKPIDGIDFFLEEQLKAAAAEKEAEIEAAEKAELMEAAKKAKLEKLAKEKEEKAKAESNGEEAADE